MRSTMPTLRPGCRIAAPPDAGSALRHGLAIWRDDFDRVLGGRPEVVHDPEGCEMVVRLAGPGDGLEPRPEHFRLVIRAADAGTPVVEVVGTDELGAIYGMLHFSKEHLGVDPLWFWADLPPVRRSSVELAPSEFLSPPWRVRYRGWFVNDEDLLIGWSDTYPPDTAVWGRVFELLLRLGGNMVIPGTDLPREGGQCELAAAMGLWLTHHHAEPLGAELFANAYPGERASYRENPALFERLWREAILRHHDRKVVWILGFRGQGDRPFWEDDPAVDTAESRGALMSRIVARQHELLRELAPGAPAAAYLYGEILQLYRDGHFAVPEDVMLIWSDNGSGKMVARRQAEDSRLPALPESPWPAGQGIYYHVAFHDLRAANHLVPLPCPADFIVKECGRAFAGGADRYVLVNCGVIRPHLFQLELLAALWRDGDTQPDSCRRHYAARLFPGARDVAADLLEQMERQAVAFGVHEDEKAGDEFYHYPARQIMTAMLRNQEGELAGRLRLFAAGPAPAAQVRAYRDAVGSRGAEWDDLECRALRLHASLTGAEQTRFRDLVLAPVRFHRCGQQAAAAVCEAFLAADAGRHEESFVRMAAAHDFYDEGRRMLLACRHGVWADFYRNDQKINWRLSADLAATLRGWIRVCRDPDGMVGWQLRHLVPPGTRLGMGASNRFPPLPDADLASALRAAPGVRTDEGA